MFRKLKEKFTLPSSNDLKKNIEENPQSVIKVTFPMGAGDVYIIRPEPQYKANLQQMLTAVDEQNTARKTFSSMNFFTGLNSQGIATIGGKQGWVLHCRVAECLTQPAELIGAVLSIQAEFFDSDSLFNVKAMTRWPAVHTIAYALLGTAGVNESLTEAIKIYDILDSKKDVATQLYQQLLATHYPLVMYGLPGAIKARDTYLAAAEQILTDLLPVITKQLTHYVETGQREKNIITITLISLVQTKFVGMGLQDKALDNAVKNELCKLISDEVKLKQYFKDPNLITLPSIVQPGVNIGRILECAVWELAGNLALNQQLIDYLAEHDIDAESSEDELKKFFEHDANNKGILNAIFLESMRLGKAVQDLNDDAKFEFNTPRYTITAIQYAGHTIPAESVFTVMDAMPRYNRQQFPDPYKFDTTRFTTAPNADENIQTIAEVFGLMKRACPAKKIVSYIFKGYICGLITKQTMEVTEDQQIRLRRR